jgi:tetratricopeptide (TPR) repeat protein
MQKERPMKSIENDMASTKCISEDLLLRYLEGHITNGEAEGVRKHLNACPVCFNVVVSVRHNEKHPFKYEEIARVEKLVTCSPEEQVDRILKEYEKLNPSASERPDQEKPGVLATILRLAKNAKASVGNWVPGETIWRPAFAAAVLLVLIGGLFGGVRFYKTTYRIGQAESILEENYKIYYADTPRLSGDYASTGIQILMGPEEEATEASYLEEARALIKAATASGSKSTKARQLLAQTFIIEKKYAKADSILEQIDPESIKSAALLNDIGVLYFEKEAWETAAHYFASAIKIEALDTAAHYFASAIKADPKFREARYNLALTKAKLGATEEAMAILNEYIGMETEEGWKNAALSFQNKLKNRE